MENFSVSVLLPTYNHAHFLKRALAALKAQSRQADEIVLVDDASTDDTPAVIDSFRTALPQLRVIRNPDNLGVNPSVNIALAAAMGTHVVCTAADDLLEPDFIEKMSATARQFPEVKLIISQYVEFREAENRRVSHGADSLHGWWYHTQGTRHYFSRSDVFDFLRRGFVWLPINTALIEKKALLEAGGYAAPLKWHADWFATYALALRHGFALAPEPLSVFRVAAETYTAGMRQPRLQRAVCLAMHDRLRQPENADLAQMMRRRPASLSPFMRHLLPALASRPHAWPFLTTLLIWWMGEVAKGRRPGFLKRFLERSRIRISAP